MSPQTSAGAENTHCENKRSIQQTHKVGITKREAAQTLFNLCYPKHNINKVIKQGRQREKQHRF